MTDFFADRLRELAIEVNDLPVSDLRRGAAAFAESIDANAALELAALVTNGSPSELDERLRSHMAQYWDLFPQRGADALVKALAVQSALDVLEEAESTATLLALSIRTRTWPKQEVAHSDVRQSAENALRRIAVTERALVPPPKIEPVPTGLKALVANAKADPSYAGLAVEALATENSRVRRGYKRLADWSAQRRATTDERSDILWWLLGARSLAWGRPFAELGLGEAVIGAARDLFALTAVVPGPVASVEFLRKALSLSPISAEDPVRQTELKSVKVEFAAPEAALAQDLPLLSMLAQSGAEPLKFKAPALSVAAELYTELCLNRLWTELE